MIIFKVSSHSVNESMGKEQPFWLILAYLSPSVNKEITKYNIIVNNTEMSSPKIMSKSDRKICKQLVVKYEMHVKSRFKCLIYSISGFVFTSMRNIYEERCSVM